MRLTVAELEDLENWIMTQPDWRELVIELDSQADGDGVVGWELLAAVRKARE